MITADVQIREAVADTADTLRADYVALLGEIDAQGEGKQLSAKQLKRAVTARANLKIQTSIAEDLAAWRIHRDAANAHAAAVKARDELGVDDKLAATAKDIDDVKARIDALRRRMTEIENIRAPLLGAKVRADGLVNSTARSLADIEHQNQKLFGSGVIAAPTIRKSGLNMAMGQASDAPPKPNTTHESYTVKSGRTMVGF